MLAAGLLVGCGGRPYLAQGQQLLDAGQPQAAIDTYREGLIHDPGNTELLARLALARHLLVESQLRQADDALRAGHYDAAQRQSDEAARAAADAGDAALAARASDAQNHLGERGRAVVAAAQASGQYVLAAELSAQLTAHVAPGSPDRQWAQEAHQAAVQAYERSAQRLAREHPGSAALALAVARRLGSAAASPAAISQLWQRFTQRICFAAPALEVHAATQVGDANLVRAVTAASEAQLRAWRDRCGSGQQPLHVHLILESAEWVDQTDSAPAAVARTGGSLQTEEVVQEDEHLVDTEERPVFEARALDLRHRDCPGDGGACQAWVQQVRRQVAVPRLQVVEKRVPVARHQMLANLPDAEVWRFARTTETRRLILRGHIAVDGASFVALPLAITALSTDSGHPQEAHGDFILPADPLETHTVAEMQAEVADRAASLVRTAVQEAARDWAEQDSNQAGASEQQSPETAEEQYLTMLALGLDDGAAVRAFFWRRYGKSADELLEILATGLNLSASVPAAAVAADLTVLYPQRITLDHGGAAPRAAPAEGQNHDPTEPHPRLASPAYRDQ